MKYLELSIAVRPDAVETAAGALHRVAPGGVSIEPPFAAIDEDGGVEYLDAPVRLRAWLPADDGSRAAVAKLREELRSLGDGLVRPLRARTVREEAWSDAWKQYFQVQRVGRNFVLQPSWRDYDPAPDDVVIVLDPGQAFGTGQHATTRLCLKALEQRLRPGAAVLDLGCGSGVLAIAAALLGAARVDALDIDLPAVEATRENAARNAVGARVRAARGSLGESWPFAQPPDGHYDLVLANISARVIQALAGPLTGALATDGLALLSGIVDDQAEATCEALTRAGGRVAGRQAEGDWRLLLVARR